MEKMFNEIARDYDFLNNIISFFTHKIIKKSAVKSLSIKPDSDVLDLCAGSGDLGRLAKDIEPSCKVSGVDISDEMLKIARERNKDITYYKQNAQNLDFPADKFDYVLMGFGFRNVTNKNAAIAEIRRVLKQNGYFLHLDFGYKNIFSKIYDAVIFCIIKTFFKNKEPYYYLLKSKQNFLTPDEIIELFQNAGFKVVKCKYAAFGIISWQIFVKN